MNSSMTAPPTMASGDSTYVRNILMDLLWTVLTFGLYNIYVNYKQIQALNAMLGTKKYDFWPWALFTLITFGIYHVYHEYRMSTDLERLLKLPQNTETILCVAFSAFGLWVVTDAIQQTLINRYYGAEGLHR